MKKLTLPLAVAVLIMTTSCHKIYTCHCTINYSDEYGSYSYGFEDTDFGTKKKVKAECQKSAEETATSYTLAGGTANVEDCRIY